MPDKSEISAVVISYNGKDFISDCLRTLQDDLMDYRHEIIIIDNHSTDNTIEIIERDFPNVNLIKNSENLGFAGAVNQGIARAKCEYIWILNQDIRVRKGCAQTLLNYYSDHGDAGMAGPRLVGFDGALQKYCRRFPLYHHILFELCGLSKLFPRSKLFNGWKMGDFDHLTSAVIEQPMGAAILIKRDRIDKVGMMDESFPIFLNDVDLCKRLWINGYRNYYCFDAVIEHYGGASVSRQKPKMVWLSHLSMIKYFAKYEKLDRSELPVKVSRYLLLGIVSFLLFVAAIPRSAYHLIRKII
ncbi:MAG: glycosyltransferase family 2 protein [candidate division Zixibacteria bacterium]